MKILNNVKLILLTFLIICRIGIAQEKGQRIFSGNIESIYFNKYQPGFKIKAEFKNQSQAKNENPEELMQSILSCTNEDWEIYQTLGGKVNADIKSEKHYSYIRTMNKDKNHFELKHKFEFLIDNVPTAILKYYLIFEEIPTPQAAIVTMQKYNGRWYKTSMQLFSKLSLLALRIKSDELENLIDGKETNQFLKDLKLKIYNNGILNFDKLSLEFDSWYSDESEQNKANKNYFKDPNSIL
jgi:hypothetical protein